MKWMNGKRGGWGGAPQVAKRDDGARAAQSLAAVALRSYLTAARCVPW